MAALESYSASRGRPPVHAAADLPSRFDPARDAAADVATAVAVAQAQGKRVLQDTAELEAAKDYDRAKVLAFLQRYR